VAQEINGRRAPHTLFSVDYQVVLLKCLKKLPEVHLMGLVVFTAHQHIVHKSKRGVQISEGVVHVSLERSTSIP
jgi:hypothetical protein